jgi:predicted kinase
VNSRSSPLLIVLCGRPFAGKTTLAKALSDALRVPRVSIDDAIASVSPWDVAAGLDAHAWEAVFAAVAQRLLRHLRAGESVIYDARNHDRASRDGVGAMARGLGAKSLLVHVDVSAELALERYDRGRQAEGRLSPERDVVAAIEGFEVPHPDEDAIVFTAGDQADAWIARYGLAKLGGVDGDRTASGSGR